MKTTAVICEYNPFHNGHRYQLEYIKEKLGADFVVSIMSGNFVQRGEPALIDKYERTRTALNNGADLVLEIPTVFAASSAAEFAAAGVGIAVKSGIIELLCFGTEGSTELEDLRQYSGLIYSDNNSDHRFAAHSLSSEASDKASDFDALIQKYLKSGETYPKAVSLAAESIYGIEKASELSLPNNILAAAYINALSHPEIFFPLGEVPANAVDIKPFAIERIGSGYADPSLSDGFASASALRSFIFNEAAEIDRISELSAYVPPDMLEALKKAAVENRMISDNDLSLLLSARLLDASAKGGDLSTYLDVSREIADRLNNNADRIMSFDERTAFTKTRQYTYSRISRALLHITLGITDKEFNERKAHGYINYLRILGFRQDAAGKGLLKELKTKALVPVVTKPADHKELISRDIYFDQLYWSLKSQKGEYERPPVIV